MPMGGKGGGGGGAEAKALPTRNLFHPQAGAYPKPFTKHRGQETFLSPGLSMEGVNLWRFQFIFENKILHFLTPTDARQGTRSSTS